MSGSSCTTSCRYASDGACEASVGGRVSCQCNIRTHSGVCEPSYNCWRPPVSRRIASVSKLHVHATSAWQQKALSCCLVGALLLVGGQLAELAGEGGVTRASHVTDHKSPYRGAQNAEWTILYLDRGPLLCCIAFQGPICRRGIAWCRCRLWCHASVCAAVPTLAPRSSLQHHRPAVPFSQEVRGDIRIAVRVRPLLHSELIPRAGVQTSPWQPMSHPNFLPSFPCASQIKFTPQQQLSGSHKVCRAMSASSMKV